MPDLKCPLCNTLVVPGDHLREPLKSQTFYDCPGCCKYSIHDLVFEHFDLEKNSDLRALISYWVRKNQKANGYPVLTTELVGKILEDVILPDINNQINELVKYLGDNSSYGKTIDIRVNNIVALIGAVDKESLLYVFDELNSQNLIEVINPKIGKESLMNRSVLIVKCQLTVNGWNKYQEIKFK